VSDLYQLAQSDKPWVAQRAQLALQLQEQYAQGSISTDEYKELLEDLVRTDVLDSEADDMHTKTMLVYAIYGLAQVV
jgi:phage tail tape-measure protein